MYIYCEVGGGDLKDLFNPEITCHQRVKPEEDIIFLG